MAWLSGLAGKAEEVLNNIDKTTAAVLKKEDGKRDFDDATLLEVRSLPSDNNLTVEEFLKNEAKYSDTNTYMDRKPTIVNKLAVSAPTTPAHGDRMLNLQSESLAWLDKATLNDDAKESLSNVPNENEYNDFEINENNTHYKINEIQNESDKLDKFSNLNGESESTNSSSSKQENVKFIDKEQQLRTDYLKEIESLRENLNLLTSERIRYIREISDLSSTLEKTRSELNSVECELEQHRARALKTLQERDKLIAELRNNSGTESVDNSVLVELNQLRQEYETLREENRQIQEKLKLARQESVDMARIIEETRSSGMKANIQAMECIAEDRKRRLDAEEDARLRSEEVRSLRQELTLKQNAFSTKIQQQEAEISKLRSQLSAAGTPNSEVESRLSSLTRTLVIKQQELEHLTTDRNALRLQLEKLEHDFQNWRKNLSFNNVNDTDDAKALLPSFLIESPFDTGVARRVKRAYSSLDAVGIRIGVFLRRYPLARIFVLLYMVLLQFWVLIVMFLQSPEAR